MDANIAGSNKSEEWGIYLVSKYWPEKYLLATQEKE